MKQKHRPRLQDVASAAGTSVATVSKVLNGLAEPHRISPKTCKRVLQVAQRLNYRPNPIAQSMRTQRTHTIGLLIASLKIEEKVEYLAEVERLAAENGYEMLTAISRWESEAQEGEIERLLHRLVDGILLLPPAIDRSDSQRVERLLHRDFPIVGIGRSGLPEMSSVDWDRAAAYKALADHLLQRGCRRFVLLTLGETFYTRERIAGVRQALKGVDGGKLEVLDTHGQMPQQEDSADVRRILRQWQPHAFLCAEVETAMGIMHLARSEGICVPSELAIAGPADRSVLDLLETPITAIRVPKEKMASLAATRLFAQLEADGEVNEPTTHLLTAELVTRESSLFVAPRA